MCHPSSLVLLVASLPTLRDHVIQPEQYRAASCSRCSSALLFPRLCPPLLCLPGTQCVSTWGTGGTGWDALTRCGRDNHGGYGQPCLPSFSFPSSYYLIFPSAASSPYLFLCLFPLHLYLLCFLSLSLHFNLYICLPLLHSCSSPGHPCAHHILYSSKCFCFHLLYFAVHPPSVTSLFLDTLGGVYLCVYGRVCVWDADLISHSVPCQINSRHLLQVRPLTGE